MVTALADRATKNTQAKIISGAEREGNRRKVEPQYARSSSRVEHARNFSLLAGLPGHIREVILT